MTAMVPTEINGRWTLLLPEHRAARPEWPWWEAGRLAAMHHVISGLVSDWQSHVDAGDEPHRDRPVVLDVGAEEGDFPALWSTWGANVMLAEPNPRVWPNIAAIFTANDLVAPLVSWPGFLGNQPDDLTERTDHLEVLGWPACADGPVIGDHGFCQLGERPDLPTATVDWLAGHTGAIPDVITMDVEGSELHVLRGAWQVLRGTWSDKRPHVFVSIHPEFMHHHYGIEDGVAEVRSLMHRAGYDTDRHVFICDDHEQHWWFQP